MTTGNVQNQNPNNIIPLDSNRDAAQTALERIFALDLSTCNLTLCLASDQTGSDVPRVRRMHLTQHAADEFRDALYRALEPEKKALDEHNMVLRAFEPDSPASDGAIEYLPIANYASLTAQIAPFENFIDTEQLCADERDFVKGLRFYVVIVQPPPSAGFQQPIYYYRWYSHTFLLKDSPQHALLWRRQQDTYDVIEEQVFLFDRHVDCISYDGQMYVLQKYYFYTIFRMEEELKKTALKALNELERMDIINNFSQFKRDCLKHKHKYRLLSKIYFKPYFHHLTVDVLEQIIDEYQRPIKVEYVGATRTKKLLYSKNEPWAILHLLDDQYFTSPMTYIDYQARGKNEVIGRASQTIRRITAKRHNQP
jgi:Domain of unknown function (DUF4868)